VPRRSKRAAELEAGDIALLDIFGSGARPVELEVLRATERKFGRDQRVLMDIDLKFLDAPSTASGLETWHTVRAANDIIYLREIA
jgi:hypothetical protein